MIRWGLAFVLGLGLGFWGGTYVTVRTGAWATPDPIVVERWIHPPHSTPTTVPNAPLTPEEERRLAKVAGTTTTLAPPP